MCGEQHDPQKISWQDCRIAYVWLLLRVTAILLNASVHAGTQILDLSGYKQSAK